MDDVPEGVPDPTRFFSGERMAMARALKGISASELAKRAGVTAASISRWEAGAFAPNKRSLSRLADALDINPLFFMKAPVEISQPKFRARRNSPSQARNQAIAYSRLVAEIVRLLDSSVGLPSVGIPSYPVDDESRGRTAVAAARATRKYLEVPDGPIPNLVRLVEHAGVAVAFGQPGNASVDAYSFQAGSRPVIILNPAKADFYRQRFDVAHELGHLVMHQYEKPDGNQGEAQANRFAAEFLTPGAEITGELSVSMLSVTTRGIGWQGLFDLKDRWGASLEMLLFRARELGVLSDVSFRNARQRMLSWGQPEPGTQTVLEMPRMLAEARLELNTLQISDDELLYGSGLPKDLYLVATSRAPYG